MIFIFFFILIILCSSFRVLREYERAVVFFLGRFYGIKGPGLILIIPVLQQMVKVDLRTIVMDVPSQDVISKDNISVRVNAVIYFRIFNPEHAIIQVENFYEATSQLAQTTLRSILGEHELDQILSKREQLNSRLQQVLDEQTDPWGIKVTNVEIKDIELEESMVKSIAKQAEAERERRAKIIYAQGEVEAAEKLNDAAQIICRNPETMKLRYLQTLSTIAGDKTSTIIFPFPTDILSKIIDLTTEEK